MSRISPRPTRRRSPAARPRRSSSSSEKRSRIMGEWILSSVLHDRIVAAAYKKRGYSGKEAAQAATFSNLTARHGIKTHNAIKALHLDELFGSKAGGCVPGAKIEKLKSPYRAVQKWNANRKLGQAVGLEAMAAAMKL